MVAEYSTTSTSVLATFTAARVVHACTRAHQAAHKPVYRVFVPPSSSARVQGTHLKEKQLKRTRVVAECSATARATQPGTGAQLRAQKLNRTRIHGLQALPGPRQTGMYRLFWWIWSKWWFWSRNQGIIAYRDLLRLQINYYKVNKNYTQYQNFS